VVIAIVVAVGFHAIVNAGCVSVAEDTAIGSGAHDDIRDGRIPAVPCSDSQPTQSFLSELAASAHSKSTMVLARSSSKRPFWPAARAGLVKCSENEYTILTYKDAAMTATTKRANFDLSPEQEELLANLRAQLAASRQKRPY